MFRGQRATSFAKALPGKPPCLVQGKEVAPSPLLFRLEGSSGRRAAKNARGLEAPGPFLPEMAVGGKIAERLSFKDDIVRLYFPCCDLPSFTAVHDGQDGVLDSGLDPDIPETQNHVCCNIKIGL
jgi:hypothetical protein